MTGSCGIFKPEDVHVVMTSSAFSTEGSDGGKRIVDTKRRHDSREDRLAGRARSQYRQESEASKTER